jgi:hypothetical protein
MKIKRKTGRYIKHIMIIDSQLVKGVSAGTQHPKIPTGGEVLGTPILHFLPYYFFIKYKYLYHIDSTFFAL